MLGVMRLQVCVFTVLLSAACTNEEQKRYEARRATNTQRLTAIQARLKAVHAAWPDFTSMSERQCPDDLLRAASPAQAGRVVVTISWPWLSQHASGRSEEWVDGKPGHFALERLEPSDTTTLTTAWETLETRPYLGVFRPAASREAKIIDPSSMVRGITLGTYAIFDSRQGKALCWFPVVASSSDEVTYRAKQGESDAMLKEKAALSVGADLVMNTEAAIRTALEAHTKVLSVPKYFSEKP